MLTYSDVKTYLTDGLTGLAFKPMPFFDPGPGTDPVVQDLVPGSMVILTVGGGPGLASEEVFDRTIVQVRTIGPQQDYEAAETLAQTIDGLMVALDHSQFVNNKWTLSVVRSGGSPALLTIDDGDRYHFTCNYVWEVKY